MFKTLFMDADDTVFDFEAAQKAAIKATFEKLGYPFNEENYKLYDEINIKHWKKLERGETVKEKLIYDRFYEFFEKTGIKGDPIKAEEEYQVRLGEHAPWIPGAKKGVEYLSKKYDIYVTTNGYGETQRSRLKLSGLGDMVKGVFISEDIGYSKPNGKYYDICLHACGADRETTLCIGDSLTSDILGGINAGMKTMWFNTKGQRTDLPVDYIVKSWDEICSIL